MRRRQKDRTRGGKRGAHVHTKCEEKEVDREGWTRMNRHLEHYPDNQLEPLWLRGMIAHC